MNAHDKLYGSMIDILRDTFGVEFEYCDTGGGCTALIGEFDGDLAVVITDAPNSVNGREATITNLPTRTASDESTVGFAVGVYRDDHCTQTAYGEYSTAVTADLPALVRMQLAADGMS